MHMDGPHKLRVVHIIPCLELGGAQQGVLELIAEQQERGFVDPSLCVLSGVGQFYETESIPAPTDVLSFGGRLSNIGDTARCARALL